MSLADLVDWMDMNTGPHTIWYVKRLAANDTLASGAHQAGPYIPKEFLFDMFPSLNREEAKNPDVRFDLRVDSHSDAREVRAIWYNNKLRGGTRNETRLTNFGGGKSALLDSESTGALAVFSFHRQPGQDASICHVWVCDSEVEADLVEDRIGFVEPGKWRIWSVDEHDKEMLSHAKKSRASCWLEVREIPKSWLTRFPTGAEIIQKTLELRNDRAMPVDTRLLRRRECEFEIYCSLEQEIELPHIQKGFETVDDFIARAQTILQRRKSRSGKSLELHTREIFIEEGFEEGHNFDHQPESDPGKRPDFLFPSQESYKNPKFPVVNLRMLATKTTCKERWRQILNEADRIENKHLLTLQEGVSETQFKEMNDAKIRLVVPTSIISSYPPSIRPRLQTFEDFVNEVRSLKV